MLNSSNILNILCSFLEILNIPTHYSEGIITGFIEVTNGVKLSSINTNPFSIIVCSFLLNVPPKPLIDVPSDDIVAEFIIIVLQLSAFLNGDVHHLNIIE